MTETGSIYPLGQFIGATRASEQAQPVYTVRIGWDLFDLEGALRLELWLLAHGVPDHDWSTSWNRQAIIERYRDPQRPRERLAEIDRTPLETSPAHIEKAFDALVNASVLVHIDPAAEPEIADTFLRRHRFLPLLTGLGEMRETPGMEQIGFRDEPMLQVTTTLADTWRAAPNFDDLMQMRDATGGTSTSERTITGEAKARQLLSDLRVFLIHEAGYLDRSMAYADEVQERWDAEATVAPPPAAVASPPASDAAPRAGARPPAAVESPAAGRWAVPSELLSGKLSPTAFVEQLYRARVTGQDISADYIVTSPTGHDVTFHSIADGVLIYTIFKKKLSADYVKTARVQVAAAAGRSIEWLVQDAKSADSIRSKLQRAGITEITVTHRPHPHN